jgi:hypothetical protein
MTARKPTRHDELPPSVTSKTLLAWVMRNPKKLPPWESNHHNENLKKLDQRWLVEWTLRKLDELDLETYRLNSAKPKPFAFNKTLSGRRSAIPHQAEIEASARRDIKLLRRMFPFHAECINPPKSPRGRSRHVTMKPEKTFSHAHWAAMDVKRIRALWVKYYGKKNRERPDPTADPPRVGQLPTAVEIARERWAEPWGGPKDEQIGNALRKISGR